MRGQSLLISHFVLLDTQRQASHSYKSPVLQIISFTLVSSVALKCLLPVPGLLNSFVSVCDRFQSRHLAIRHSINEKKFGRVSSRSGLWDRYWRQNKIRVVILCQVTIAQETTRWDSLQISFGARFSKDPETFRVRKAIAKSRTLRLQSCFIFFIWTEVPTHKTFQGHTLLSV